jgi:hypothetical protein
MTPLAFFGSFIFSGIGVWLFREGKRRTNFHVLIIGIVMAVYPYFTSSDKGIWFGGILLCFAAKYFWQ